MKKITVSLLALLLAVFSFNRALSEEPILFAPFSAQNVRGEDVITEAIFAEAEITILNFWATWCPPCVQELPDLAKLSDSTDGRAQVIGVLMDGVQYDDDQFVRDEEALGVMNELLDNCDAAFAVVLPEDLLLASLASLIQAVPTSFIVNADGEVVDTIIGSRTESEWIEIVEKHAE